MIRYFAAHPTGANLLLLFLTVLGLSVLSSLKRETFPDFTPKEIEVRVPYPGASAEDVEEALCRRLEDAIDVISDVAEPSGAIKVGLAVLIIFTGLGVVVTESLAVPRSADVAITVAVPVEVVDLSSTVARPFIAAIWVAVVRVPGPVTLKDTVLLAVAIRTSPESCTPAVIRDVSLPSARIVAGAAVQFK